MRWGIVGPGEIARSFGDDLGPSGAGNVAWVRGRDAARRERFAKHHGALALAADAPIEPGSCDAVYVATPHPSHASYVESALALGIPVLCEKPLTTTPERTAGLFRLAEERGAILAEAYMYRAHPLLERTFELVAQGAIGEVQEVQAWFGFAAPFDPKHRLFAPELGGGAILDVGGYPLSFAWAVARAAAGSEPREAHCEHAEGELAATGVDARASARWRFSRKLTATLRCAIDKDEGRGAQIVGSAGRIVLDDPFLIGGHRAGRAGKLTLHGESGRRSETLRADCTPYGLEARAFARLVEEGAAGASFPLVSRIESEWLAQSGAEWRERVGVKV